MSARLVTNAGDSICTVAAMWLVYRLGGSSFYTGLAGFLTMLPQSLQFLAGPLVDRWPLRRTLALTQAVQAVAFLAVPLAAAFDVLAVWQVLVLMPLLALLNQFVYPAEQAALPRVLPKEDLVRGNSLFAFAYQGVDFAFNALAGLLVAAVGAVSLYVVDSVTFLVAALLFAGLRTPRLNRVPEEDAATSTRSAVSRYFEDLKEGIRLVTGSNLTRVLPASLVANFLIGATLAVLPTFSDRLDGPEVYGDMLAGLAGGVTVGALLASLLGRFRISGLVLAAFLLGGTAWLTALWLAHPLWTVLFFALAWVPVGATNVIFLTVLQRVVPERLLARVFSVVASASTAMMPLGSLLGGLAGDLWGSVNVMAAGGLGFIVAGLDWGIDPVLRAMPATEAMEPRHFGLAESSSA